MTYHYTITSKLTMSETVKALLTTLKILTYIGLLSVVVYFAKNVVEKFSQKDTSFTASQKIDTYQRSPTFVFCVRPTRKQTVMEENGLEEGYFTIFGKGKL